MKTAKNPVIQNDVMRYKKNKLGSNLALLGLVFGCLYFLILYAQVKNGNYYYNWQIAFDVIYNLFFMLFVFLFSEQVKNYDRKLFILQIIVGVFQIARIFWLPLAGVTHEYTVGNETFKVIDGGTFAWLTISLAISGALIIASAVIGYIRSKSVEEFTKKIESGEIDLDAELKKADNATVAENNAETAGGEVNA